MGWKRTLLAGSAAATAAVATYDLVQRQHAVLRNFPIVGHLRYLLEEIGPEFRQYVVTSNTEELPFNRDQRRWIYASSKHQNNYFAFGTVQELERSPNYLIVKHSSFPLLSPQPGEPGYDPQHHIPVAKVLGAARARRHAFRPASVINISGMSFGSLSANAIAALNEGAERAGCLHNTGEGGLSTHHQRGGELIWQLGSGYFGARDDRGRFDMTRLKDVVAANPVRAIEVKLSQGAKPGLGGVLPAAKVTPEISRIRGVPIGKDCISPAAHPEFHDVDTMLDFVERIAAETGLPVGIKSAVGDQGFWTELAERMAHEDRGVDFITIDGGEGGTGAAPLAFTDQVALPFKLGFSRVYAEFAKRGIADDIVFIGSGKLGFPEEALLAFALGCDMVNVGREAMMSIGCIQAQRCHTGRCPVGVATQSQWLMRGLDPEVKSARLANYVVAFRKELLALCRACGVEGPALVSLDHLDVIDDRFGSRAAREVFGYAEDWGVPPELPGATLA
ncbi:MAG: FMN-binding glutamate synthase family protein [Chloroflexi bacterium]|nr:FMN-binding glutamate synthase family protein [Chloroflexota bacterium]MDA1146213.1 FMN-binding glutamate synthase family protein [Chloroflexota bacterium]